MAIEATRIFTDHPEWHRPRDGGIRRLYEQAILVESETESQSLLRGRRPKIVIAGAGMITGGRVLNHLRKHLNDKRATVLLVGYQAPGTRGRLLQDGAPELKLHGEYVSVKARIEMLDSLSAHADGPELLHWLRGFERAPKMTYLVHGEPQAQDALQLKLRDSLGWESYSPVQNERIVLAKS